LLSFTFGKDQGAVCLKGAVARSPFVEKTQKKMGNWELFETQEMKNLDGWAKKIMIIM